MTKAKTCKTARARFKITARGKLLHYRPGRKHLMSGISPARRRRMRKADTIKNKAQEKRMKQLLPYDL